MLNEKKTMHTIAEWSGIFADFKTGGIADWFKRNYGDNEERIPDRASRFRGLLAEASRDTEFSPLVRVIVGRTPCRARVFGGHTDFIGCGGYLINLAGNLEMMYLAQPREDRKVVLRNMNPVFGACGFSLDDWDVKPGLEINAVEDWDRWCTEVEKKKKQNLLRLLKMRRAEAVSDGVLNEEWANLRDSDWQEFVKGIAAFMQTDLGDSGGGAREKIRGVNAMFWSEIPMGWGLSSSSALVMSVARIFSALFNLNLTDSEMIYLGFSEHYNGTMGGINDHASIMRGIAGKILMMRSFPEEIVESVKFSEGVSLFLVDSGVKRSQAPEISGKLKREGIKNSAVILARTGVGYAIACLWIRHNFPEYRAHLQYDPENKKDVYGLLRQFNQTGRIDFKSENERDAEIYRILRNIPQRITREELVAEMPEFGKELEGLFVTHPEPDGGYHLRGMALYGLAENERIFEYMKHAASGDFKSLLELMRISHNGDRAAGYEFDGRENSTETPYSSPVTDEDLDMWAETPGQNPVWRKPGFFERSIECVDFLCDLIDEHFGEAAAARISAAGLGGAAAVLARSDHVERIRDFLSERGYKSIPPLTPSASASIVEV